MDLAQLAFEASLRALDKQEQLLEEVRARTGLLLAASSVGASFLGEPALDSGELALAIPALVAFAASTAASIYVLLPKRQLVFSLVGSRVYEELYALRSDLHEIHRRLAYDLDRFWDANDVTMARLFRVFRLAVVALAVEILLLLAAVGVTLF